MLFLESFKIDSSPQDYLFYAAPQQTLANIAPFTLTSLFSQHVYNIYLFTLIMQSFLVVMKRSFSF